MQRSLRLLTTCSPSWYGLALQDHLSVQPPPCLAFWVENRLYTFSFEKTNTPVHHSWFPLGCLWAQVLCAPNGLEWQGLSVGAAKHRRRTDGGETFLPRRRGTTSALLHTLFSPRHPLRSWVCLYLLLMSVRVYLPSFPDPGGCLTSAESSMIDGLWSEETALPMLVLAWVLEIAAERYVWRRVPTVDRVRL